MENKELIEKLRGYHLPAQTIGKEETYCDEARANFLNEAIPLISAEAERAGYFKGYQHRAEVHTEIINHEAVAEARKQERERIRRVLEDGFAKVVKCLDSSELPKEMTVLLRAFVEVTGQALKEGGKEAE